MASPTPEFYKRGGDLFDQWGICRTRAYGDDGFFQASEDSFRPVIAFESLGDEAERAYELGAEFAEKYADENRLAEAIFNFVRDGIRYASDRDQFGHRDFAQNADELIRVVEGGKRFARGDCEDYAVLLAVMWRGAGLRSAIVLAPEHAAALVHLPKYRSANMVWQLRGEDGWIWAEATGSSNPLGWTPEGYVSADLLAYEITDQASEAPEIPPEPPGQATGTTKRSRPFLDISPFFSMIFFLWIVSAVAQALRRRG